VGFFDEFGGGGETLGLAGSENEQGFGKIALDYAEHEQSQRLFGGDNAARYDEGTTAVAGAFFFEPSGEGSGRGQFQVVFEIAADGDSFGWGSEGANAVGILLGLHEEAAGVAEGGFEERFQVKAERGEIALPASERTIGDASADEENGDVAAARFTEKVWPDFGFEDDDDGGFDGVEDAANTEGPVEGKIEYSVGEGHALFGEGVTGERRGRDNEGALGVGVLQVAGEGHTGEGFTHGDGVNPDGAGMLSGEFFESQNGKAEALAEIGKIFAVPQALD